MPGVVDMKRENSQERENGSRDDLSTLDEVKVFKDEEDENEQMLPRVFTLIF
jgi:hypothetical protein